MSTRTQPQPPQARTAAAPPDQIAAADPARRRHAAWESIVAYALERVRTPGMSAALGSLMPQFGAEIPSTDLGRIAVPTALIWGRHDLQVPVRIAEAASARRGWPLHVTDDAGDDPPMERPVAFIEALRAALAPLTRAEAAS